MANSGGMAQPRTHYFSRGSSDLIDPIDDGEWGSFLINPQFFLGRQGAQMCNSARDGDFGDLKEIVPDTRQG